MNYYVYARDNNGNLTYIYMDNDGVERTSPIPRMCDLESIPKLIKFAFDNWQAAHVEIHPV